MMIQNFDYETYYLNFIRHRNIFKTQNITTDILLNVFNCTTQNIRNNKQLQKQIIGKLRIITRRLAKEGKIIKDNNNGRFIVVKKIKD